LIFMQRATGIAALVLGLAAVAALAGAARGLGAETGFLLTAPAVLLFPGAAAAALVPGLAARRPALAAVGLWFPAGVSCVCLFGFLALAFKASLEQLTIAVAAGYACLLAALAVRYLGRRGTRRPESPDEAAGQGAGQPGRRSGTRLVPVILLLVAIGCGLVTLVTPRNEDDWYYLAYIRDFVSGSDLRSEDAIEGPTRPASPRIWYASWWVAEALIARASGSDPVTAHQVYFPMLVVPFVVLATFTLAREIFPDGPRALTACCFQVLFYASSAYPHNSSGWMVFCRSSQDKTLASFLMVPAVAAVALRIVKDLGGGPEGLEPPDGKRNRVPLGRPAWQPAACYAVLVLGAVLVHPLSVAWIGTSAVAYALVEAVRSRRRRALIALVLIALPVLALGAILASGTGDVASDLDAKAARQSAAAKETGEAVSSADRKASGRWSLAAWPSYLYLPGEGFPWASEEGDFSTVIRRGGDPVAANPSYVLRFPLATAGMIGAILLLAYVRRDPAARYLATATFAIVLAAFVPVTAALSAKVLTWKMVYRLSWALPWGLVLGFWASRVGPGRRRWWTSGLAAVALAALIVGRGDPVNYVRSFRAWPQTSRPQPQTVEVLRFLASRPAPQGVVLASAGVSQMVPAFVAAAYPAAYRGAGTLSRRQLDALLGASAMTPDAVSGIRGSQARYVIAEKTLPLNRALRVSPDGFQHIYANSGYDVWEVLESGLSGQAPAAPAD